MARALHLSMREAWKEATGKPLIIVGAKGHDHIFSHTTYGKAGAGGSWNVSRMWADTQRHPKRFIKTSIRVGPELAAWIMETRDLDFDHVMRLVNERDYSRVMKPMLALHVARKDVAPVGPTHGDEDPTMGLDPIDGHHRCLAAIYLKVDQMPVLALEEPYHDRYLVRYYELLPDGSKVEVPHTAILNFNFGTYSKQGG